MTPAELVLRHLALIRSSHEHTLSQIDALADYVKGLQGQAQETARVELPAHCDGIPERLCALRCEDARMDKASLANPRRFLCRGCGAVSQDGVTTTK